MISILIDQVETVIYNKEINPKVKEFIAQSRMNLDGIIKGIFPMPKKKKNKLIIKITNAIFDTEVKYIEKLKNELEDIVKAKPIRLHELKNEFDAILNADKISGKRKSKFRNKILLALGYKSLRSVFYPKYFQLLGIKACVYCNSQLTVSAEGIETWVTEKLRHNRSNPTLTAKFQVDHIIPKSHYPCFSISFYNLYPVCGSCNNVKSAISLDFNLYTSDSEKIKKSDFEFKLSEGSVANYLIYKDNVYINIDFQDNKKHYIKENSEGKTSDIFDIKGIYSTQKDLAEELIIKAQIYTDSYKKGLVNSFRGLFTNASLSNRILIGNYTNPEDIHKRPMAKFTQDISRQLKLIK